MLFLDLGDFRDKMYDDKNLVLSIRFKSKTDISEIQCNQPCVSRGQSMHFRSKPPSAVTRDCERRQQWFNGKQDQGGECQGGEYAHTCESVSFAQTSGLTLSPSMNDGLYNQHGIDSGYDHSSGHVMDIQEPGLISHSTPIGVHNVATNTTNCPVLQNTNIEDAMVQTDSIVGHVSVQTSIVTIQACDASFQFPDTKRKRNQTSMSMTCDVSQQTTRITKTDVGNQSNKPEQCHQGHMTDYTMGDHKCVSTEPPMSRHMQTWILEHADKKCGPSYVHAATQLNNIYQVEEMTQTTHDHHLESSDAFLYHNQQRLNDWCDDPVYKVLLKYKQSHSSSEEEVDWYDNLLKPDQPDFF